MCICEYVILLMIHDATTGKLGWPTPRNQGRSQRRGHLEGTRMDRATSPRSVTLEPGDEMVSDAVTARAGHHTSAKTPSHSAARRVLGVLAAVVSSTIVLGIVAVAVALSLVPAIAGGHTLTVLSGSMAPSLPAGSVVIDRAAPASSLQVGDVVTYATTDEVSGAHILITHRIIALRAGSTGAQFITKGDANGSADDRAVSSSQIRGMVWYHVPYIGIVRNFLLTKGALLTIAGATVLIGALRVLSKVIRSDPEPPSDAAPPRASSGKSRRRGDRHT